MLFSAVQHYICYPRAGVISVVACLSVLFWKGTYRFFHNDEGKSQGVRKERRSILVQNGSACQVSAEPALPPPVQRFATCFLSATKICCRGRLTELSMCSFETAQKVPLQAAFISICFRHPCRLQDARIIVAVTSLCGPRVAHPRAGSQRPSQRGCRRVALRFAQRRSWSMPPLDPLHLSFLFSTLCPQGSLFLRVPVGNPPLAVQPRSSHA